MTMSVVPLRYLVVLVCTKAIKRASKSAVMAAGQVSQIATEDLKRLKTR